VTPTATGTPHGYARPGCLPSVDGNGGEDGDNGLARGGREGVPRDTLGVPLALVPIMFTDRVRIEY
jgi:hypothetical protein